MKGGGRNRGRNSERQFGVGGSVESGGEVSVTIFGDDDRDDDGGKSKENVCA